MSRKRKYNARSPIWTWISFIVFALIITLLASALIRKESPAEVLRSLYERYTSSMSEVDRMSKKKLRSVVKEQRATIDSLALALESFQQKNVSKTAYISTQSESLNMREEPSLSSSVIMKIPNRSKVTILHCDNTEYYLDGANGVWCRISFDDMDGWVWGNYLDTAQ